jgi:N-acetylmuramoyl-L-alanine amidase
VRVRSYARDARVGRVLPAHALARALCCWVCLTIALVAGLAAAQPALVVNGLEVAGVTSTLVPGNAYAPAAAFAAALGARFDVDAGARLVTLTLGGRLVQLRIVDDPGRAHQVDPAVTVDGRARAGPAAVYVGVEPYVPVKATGEALGAAVSFLADRNVVAVVLPTATVSARVDRSGAQERLVLRASAPTRVSTFYNAPVRTLQLRFERAEIGSALALEGAVFVRADVLPARGAVDVRIQLGPDGGYSLAELPDGDGFVVVVGFGAESAAAPVASGREAAVRVVLDPARGGADEGHRFGNEREADLTLALALRLEAALARAGIDVELTRRADDGLAVRDRAAMGTGADLFVSLHAGQLPRGQLRVHYLGEAASLPTLEDAIRFNAETSLRRPETDGIRRQVLLDLVVDLGVGRRYAEALAAELLQAGGYLVDGPRGAPLAVLTGAGGRGLLIEVGVDDLRDPSFAPILAATLATVVGSGGLVP